MKSIVFPSKITGSITVPSSKSYAQRAILAAAIYGRSSRIYNLDLCDDTSVALQAAIDLGCQLIWVDGHLQVIRNNEINNTYFFAGESGLTCRLLAAILMIKEGHSFLDGLPSLQRRPLSGVKSVSKQLGVDYKDTNGFLPLEFNGSPKSVDLEVDGSISSQFISGLLMALPMIDYAHEIKVQNLTSRPYIDMTIEMLKAFGVQWKEESPDVFSLEKYDELDYVNVHIERDWSAASLILAASAIAGNVQLENMNFESLQADKEILKLNGLVKQSGDSLIVANKIEAFNFDANNCPDLFPPLVALAHYASGVCRIEGVSRLKYKESNRSQVLQSEFNKIGGRVRIEGDTMIIEPRRLFGGVVDAHGDHRIAMALSVAALGAEAEVTILGSECVAKSYPGFFKDLASLGAKIKEFE